MRCAIYCRISRDDGIGSENESIGNQRSLLNDYAEKKGWSIEGVFIDEDMSGADSHRPAWTEMLEGAKAGRYDVILCKSQSRFTRDIEMAEHYLHGLLPQWGVRFVSVADNIDTDRKENKKARQINGLVNEWYLEDLSDSIRLVLDHKRREGKFIGSFAPYGYKRDDGDRGRIIPDEKAADVVRSIFTMYDEGISTSRIAEQLNEKKIPNPTAYKQSIGLKYKNEPRGSGSLWSRTSVRRILSNEVYIGTLQQGKRRKISYKSGKIVSLPRESWIMIPNNHTPIVAKDVFERVNQSLRDRGMRRGPVNDRKREGGDDDPI